MAKNWLGPKSAPLRIDYNKSKVTETVKQNEKKTKLIHRKLAASKLKVDSGNLEIRHIY